MNGRLVTLEQVRDVRRRIDAYLAEEMRELGADATAFAREAAGMGGLEFFRQWLRAEIPPPPEIAVLFGMEWTEIEPARVTGALAPADWMFNGLGSIHGGVAATTLDTALGTAVHTTLPAGTGYATTDLHVRYVRAMTADTGRVIASASVVHAGRRHATAEGRLEAEETGKLIATGTASFAIFRPAT